MTKAEKTRQFIIEKSAPVFNTKGLAGTAMSDVMKATRLAKGSLYVHFEDKEELSHAVVDYNLKMVLDKPLAEATRQQTAKAKLLTFLTALSDRNPTIVGGCPMLNFGMEADDTSPVVKTKVNKVMDKIQSTIRSFVELGIRQGEFRKGWKAKAFAAKAFALIEGGIMMAKISGDRNKLKAILGFVKKEIDENSI